MPDSLKQGRCHYLISTITLLKAAIDTCSSPLPIPDFLSSDHSKLNLWFIESELMDNQTIQKSLDFGLFTKQWAPNAQQKIDFILSKEMMCMIPTFRDLLSKYTDNELKQRLLVNQGIHIEIKNNCDYRIMGVCQFRKSLDVEILIPK